MNVYLLLLLFAALAGYSVGTYSYKWRKIGSPCNPSVRKPCGEHKVISERYYPCSNCRGSNVCRKVTTFQRHFYSCVYKKKCSWYGYYCRYYCARTDKCDYVKTYSTTKYTCCYGYTTAASPSDHHHKMYSRSSYYLKKYGCPRTIVNTTLQCLNELGLTELADLVSGLGLQDALNGDLGGNFTVFAPNNRILSLAALDLLAVSDLETAIGSHVVADIVPAVKLYDGQKIETVVPGRFIHVAEIELKKWISYKYSYYERIFVNGHEITTRDACVATNGIVHVIDGIIDSSNKTIAQVVRYSQNLTNLNSLLTAASLTSVLSNPTPLLTLFAPTNQAIERASESLGLNLLQCLLAPANREALRNFLLYHVTCGADYSSTIVLRPLLTTKACKKKKYYYYKYLYYRRYYKYITVCKKLKTKVTDSGITVGGELLTHLDIPASNGVVHYLAMPLVNPWVDLRTVCRDFPRVTSRIIPLPPPVPHPPPGY